MSQFLFGMALFGAVVGMAGYFSKSRIRLSGFRRWHLWFYPLG